MLNCWNLFKLALVAACFAFAPAVARAGGPTSADNETAQSAKSVAPSVTYKLGSSGNHRPVLVGRDPMSFRRPGTLLAQTTRTIPKVDPKVLYERKLAMLHGEHFHSAPENDPRAVPVDGGGVTPGGAPAEGPATSSSLSDSIGWILLGLLALAALVAWKMGWFVSASARAEEQRGVTVVSLKTKGRLAKTSGPRVELVKHGR